MGGFANRIARVRELREMIQETNTIALSSLEAYGALAAEALKLLEQETAGDSEEALERLLIRARAEARYAEDAEAGVKYTTEEFASLTERQGFATFATEADMKKAITTSSQTFGINISSGATLLDPGLTREQKTIAKGNCNLRVRRASAMRTLRIPWHTTTVARPRKHHHDRTHETDDISNKSKATAVATTRTIKLHTLLAFLTNALRSTLGASVALKAPSAHARKAAAVSP